MKEWLMHAGMNLLQLRVFRDLMDTGSVSETARKLGRTQPAISLSLKKLEKSLDLKLFERRGRQLIPVPEAHYLMAEASDILDRLSTVSGTIKGLVNAESGSLHIATMPGPSAYLFPRFISKAVAGSPDVRVTLSSRSSPQIRELAGTQNIDFGFADFDQPVGKPPHYETEIARADCFFALSRTHSLASNASVSIVEMSDVPMGMLHPSHPFPRRVLRAFEQQGARFNSVVTSQFFMPMIPFISAGQCCAIVDPLTVATERRLNSSDGRILFLPIHDNLRYEYAILTPSLRPPSQLALRIAAGWKSELAIMLGEIGANLEFEPSTD